jgi:hypothetical protein
VSSTEYSSRSRMPPMSSKLSTCDGSSGGSGSTSGRQVQPVRGGGQASPPPSDECPLSAGRPRRLRRRSPTAKRVYPSLGRPMLTGSFWPVVPLRANAGGRGSAKGENRPQTDLPERLDECPL